MIVATDDFRRDFAEFRNPEKFTDDMCVFWLTIANAQVNQTRWDANLYVMGMELFAAHHIVLESENKDVAAYGGRPGLSKGPVNSRSADKVSLGYDTQAVIEEDGGHWNLTTYGTRFLRIARMMGSGPVML